MTENEPAFNETFNETLNETVRAERATVGKRNDVL
jgi:hypothetical protein